MVQITSARSRTPILFAHWGEEGIRGSERVLLDLLARIDRDRFVPAVWCNAEAMAKAAREVLVPARVSRMPILLGWDAPKLDTTGYRALVREGTSLIREFGARLVHANSGAPNQWLVPAARRTRVPLIAHLHATYGLRERCTLLLHQAPVVVGCSRAVVDPFLADGMPESRLRVIHNGIEPSRVGAGNAEGLRQALGVNGDALLVACAGALVELKGFDIVIRALALLRPRGIDAHLAIAGEGPEREKLRSLANELGLENRVHFLGERRDIGAIFRDAADIVAVGSRIESFGLVAAEAGAVGRPTVATRVGGIVEVVQDGVTGLLVPSEDHNSFADALARLSADPDLRRAMGSAARAHVHERFTAEHAAHQFEDLYTELTSRPSESFGWSRLGFQLAPFARLASSIVGRRLGALVANPHEGRSRVQARSVAMKMSP